MQQVLFPSTTSSRVIACGSTRLRLRRGPSRVASTSTSWRMARYRRPKLWLSAGWDCVSQRGRQAPLYWEGKRRKATDRLHAVRAEADRARRSGLPCQRLPEAAAYAKWRGQAPAAGAGNGKSAADDLEGVGQVWEWTASPYTALPGLPRTAGRDRRVQRQVHGQPDGAARRLHHATPPGHLRTTYRNFFPPDARWMFPADSAWQRISDERPRPGSRSRANRRSRGIPPRRAGPALVVPAARHPVPVSLRRARLRAVRTRFAIFPEYYVTRTETAILPAATPRTS